MPLFFFCLLMLSCDEKECCVFKEGSQALTGTWLLYEYGYSPGAGYITENVSPLPPQTLTLKENGEMTSTIEGLKNYKFYLILEDTLSSSNVLAVFEQAPSNPDLPLSEVKHGYNFSLLEDNRLRLNFRFCIEGCHLGLKKID